MSITQISNPKTNNILRQISYRFVNQTNFPEIIFQNLRRVPQTEPRIKTSSISNSTNARHRNGLMILFYHCNGLRIYSLQPNPPHQKYKGEHSSTNLIWTCIGTLLRCTILICPQIISNIEKLISIFVNLS
jgi:hypothetical protein